MSSDPAVPQAKPSSDTKGGPSKNVLIPVMLGGAVICLILVVLAIVLIVRSLSPPAATEGMPLEITRISSPSISPLPLPAPPVLAVGDTQIALPVPVSLEIEGRSFAVKAVDLDDPAWEDPSSHSGSALWGYGTVVNYVVGLEDTQENQALMDELSLEDPILLRLSSGVRLTFRVIQKDDLVAGDIGVYAQARPGMTLLLLGEETWAVVYSDFDRAEEPEVSADGPAAGVGQSVQVGDAQIIVTEGYAVPSSMGLAPGTMYYVVEFSLQNTGQLPLDMGGLVMELLDGVGNRYLLSPAASAQGAYGLLEGFVAPGAGVNGSAGYLVPAGMTGPTLIWSFGPVSSGALRAQVSIPFTPPPVTVALPEVDVLDAFLGEGGSTLHIVAEVYNGGTALLVVTQDDISLSSSSGLGVLQMTAPQLPWSIAGNDWQDVELDFVRPSASSCIVTILGHTFEISGLR